MMTTQENTVCVCVFMTGFYMTANIFFKYILYSTLKFHHVNSTFKKNSKKQLNYWLKGVVILSCKHPFGFKNKMAKYSF